MFNLYTNFQLRALKGVSQKMWDTLFTLFDLYGPIPRLLFETLLPPKKFRTEMVSDATAKDEELNCRIREYRDELENKIHDAVQLDPNTVLSTEYGVNSSHTIYTMRPRKMKKYQYVSLHAAFGFATADIGRRIAEATIAISLKDAQRLYDFLLGQGATKTSAGWVFEVRMHQIFQRGGLFVATKQGGQETITIDIHSCGDFSQVSGVGDLLRERPGSQRIKPDIIGRYFKPQHCNLPSVDSFAVTECAAAGGEVLVLFQMTVSTEHPVKAEGLASIWAVIPQALRRAPPILVFVVPADVASRFASKKQIISGPANQTSASRRSTRNHPDFETWEQYVLPVGEKTLWENTMK